MVRVWVKSTWEDKNVNDWSTPDFRSYVLSILKKKSIASDAKFRCYAVRGVDFYLMKKLFKMIDQKNLCTEKELYRKYIDWIFLKYDKVIDSLSRLRANSAMQEFIKISGMSFSEDEQEVVHVPSESRFDETQKVLREEARLYYCKKNE